MGYNVIGVLLCIDGYCLNVSKRTGNIATGNEARAVNEMRNSFALIAFPHRRTFLKDYAVVADLL